MSAPLPPAIVLTAGLGTRLSPLTTVRAKPSVPVAGVPMVLRVLQWLANQGVRSVVLNLHHKPETVTRIVGHGDAIGIRVQYSWEPTILGSAGGPRKALQLLGRRFFMVNGDTLTDLALPDLQRTHDSMSADVTLAVTDNPDASRYGGVIVGSTGFALGFRPAGQPSRHFVGVQLAESAVFQALREGEPAATIGGIYDAMIANETGRIATHDVKTAFHDIGTPADYLAASLDIARAEGRESLPIGERSHVQPTAVLTRTIVWDDVTISNGCRLTDCIVADGVQLPAGTVCDQGIIVSTPDGPSFSPFGDDRHR